MENLYFLGIGGIGMSALARYFRAKGYNVSGYDRTPSMLTYELEQENIPVSYTSDLGDVEHLSPSTTLVVRTPAVPEDEGKYTWLRTNGFTILKRSEVLGIITRQERALCVAGTHGKTTTSTILAHLLHESHVGTNAFLGGISNNYQSNLLLDAKSDLVVVEADEYDRSFHHLTPYMSVITSIDPDHLDIYNTPAAYHEGFDIYAGLVSDTIVLKQGYRLDGSRLKAKVYTYSGEWQSEARPDFFATNIVVDDGQITFDLVGPKVNGEDLSVSGLTLGVPVWVNIENSVAAMAIARLNGVTPEEIRAGLASYSGVYRRFNIHVNTRRIAYVDDYAHHPTELEASISSIRKLYPTRYIIAVFQPHLYTRTRDFADGFKKVLGKVDELILLPIYPARELPIPGVTSEMLGGKVVEKKDLLSYLRQRVEKLNCPIVVLTLGAGDIDRLVADIATMLHEVER
ncbi:MAG: UDP-N-acetylmuramate--L-alanine ligase [Paludibacteraceae bacterium]|nr:UDP-N-acetylmuramate--L-alanine ligase [Paludibacteraceae bacterium]MBR2266147.1 UDP-N-acetylmuramate--L-alanine ligase [Paludibacteraceae bacterium]